MTAQPSITPPKQAEAEAATDKVLFVDDDVNILSSFRRRLGRRFNVTTVLGGAEALDVIDKEGPVAVVVSDQRMPGMDGITLLREVKKRTPDTVRMMLTGNTDQPTAVQAVNEGSVYRFYTKPCPPEDLADGIETGLRHYQLVTAERELLERTLAGSVKVLVDVLSLSDPEAFRRTGPLRDWAGKLAVQLGLNNGWEIDIAAMLSPIGLITVPDEVLARLRAGEKLSPVDREIIDRSPEVGRNLIANIPRLAGVADIIHYQAKGFDGSGFPEDWIAGSDIPLGARILKLLNDLLNITEAPDLAAFTKLELHRERYDPELLERARAVLIAEDHVAGDWADREVVVVPPATLLPGSLLVSNIETADGTLVLAAGNRITMAQVELLRNLKRVRPLKEPIHIVPPPPKTGWQ